MTAAQLAGTASINSTPTIDAEAELIRRIRTDRSAFAIIYRRHQPQIARYVFRRTGDVHATEDIVADVFLAAFKSIGRFESRGVPLRYWLLRIATNACNRWARQSRRRTMATISRDPIDPTTDPPSRAGGPEAAQALAAMRQLPPRYQAVLSLHHVEGLPVRDVARILGVREGTVKSRLSRARDALREHLRRTETTP